MNLTKKLLIISLLIVGTSNLFAFTKGPQETVNFDIISIQTDTIPIEDTYGDFLTDPNTNPFDIQPSNLEQKVEYDPSTNTYVVFEKIGEEYYKTPVTMTFKEYLEWRSKYEEKRYFNKLAGVGDEYRSKSGITDPISRIDIKDDIVDRLFGGSGVTIKPQGNIDLTILPIQYQYNANPNIFADLQRQYIFLDFDPVIQMNVDGGIGDKMDLNFNYNTQSTFDFDQKIKLAYDSEEFNEDDIIKKIEAGNVSLPLRSSLIQGAQQLFGLKTELQFGHLRLTAIASQQKSEQENLQIQNGAQVQRFEIRPDEYDENRHFFISHYHRNNYERTLENLPYLNTAFRVNRIQVWVSNDRPEFQQNSAMIAAISDLGQGVDSLFTENNQGNPQMQVTEPYPQILTDRYGGKLPDNRSNTLYVEQGLETDEATRRIENTSTLLQGKYGLKQTDDFETFRGRLLSPSEYTFNPELGFISLNIRLKANQVLGVAYDYYYTFNCDTLYTVGELSEENTISDVNEEGETESASVLYVKMLKNSRQNVSHPTWDLMMKNVYALRTNQLNPDDFSFDIYFEDDDVDGSLKKFLPFPQVNDLPLLNMFNLDRLNSQNDKQPDGVFDFVPGVTVIPRNGSIIFPKLEPFGSGLDTLVTRGVPQADVDRYKFQELYDEAIIVAREKLEQNKFVMVGEYKSSVSSEIALGAWNLPPNSLRVRAGSQLLVEGQDYEVDYGSGRLRILNETYLQQGVPLDISFEDSSVFSFQQKSMLGLRADYALSKYANIGATYLRMSERPFTEKVNIGDDPINNRIFGIDFDYSKDAPWLTKAVDKLPIYSTKEPSNVLFTAEVAALKPGHPKVINLSGGDTGVVNIDDFEGAVSGLPLGTQTNLWSMSSVPSTLGKNTNNQRVDLPESQLKDDLALNANRALLNWYVIDRGDRSTADDIHSYSRAVDQDELFQRNVPPGQFPDIYTFDLTYYPDQRGPYNFDLPDGRDNLSAGVAFDQNDRQLKLLEPESRWGGITRYMVNNDFQNTNYEFIDFWMLNPYMEREDETGHLMDEEGRLIFQLGNISEDVMKDNLQFYENSIPTKNQETPVRNTNLGEVPLDIPVNNGFEQQFLDIQDVGFDGLTDEKERVKFEDWLNAVSAIGYIGDDPSNDNFLFYGDASLEGEDLQTRYKRFNNPQGNAPTGTGRVRGNPTPDAEDLNNNKSLDESESYWEYTVNLFPTNAVTVSGDEVAAELDVSQSQYYTETKTITNPRNGDEEKWYRFRIPLNDGQAFNGIEGFRSIQFMRMITTGFKTQKTMRMADFELVRNQWRKLDPICQGDVSSSVDFSVDVVGVEENSSRDPFNYTIPEGIKQETVFGNFANVLQDEKSMALDFCHMADSCEVSIYKLTELDMRFFERLQMFVHAEASATEGDVLENGDLALFVRIGKDFVNNYYEYEIPLILSEVSDTTAGAGRVWRMENELDANLKNFTDLKKFRNINGASPLERYSSTEGLPDLDLPFDQKIYIKGNPTLGFVKGVQVGVRNIFTGEIEDFCGQVWINELRAAGFKEQGGVAGLARLDVQMADLGNVTVSGNYSSIGWGALDQQLAERQLEEIIEYDAATNLELGKFLPNNWNVSIPFYAQYAKSITNPLYDAIQLDLTLDEVTTIAREMGEDPAPLIERSQDVTTIKTINFTNVRKDRGSGKSNTPDFSGKGVNKGDKANPDGNKGDLTKTKEKKQAKPMPWDISNFSVSYAYTETNHRNPFLSVDDSKDYRASLDYSYSNKFKGFTPFKTIAKKPYLKVIKELNVNPLPSSFTFNTNVNRFISTRRFRLPVTPIFEFDDRVFDWRRRYNLKWDLMRNLKMNFVAENRSIIDELRQTGIAANTADREWVDERGNFTTVSDDQQVQDYWIDNLREGGRNTDYNHQLSLNYTLPTKNIRILNWINVKAIYKSDYSWIAGPLIIIDDLYDIGPGAVIQNSQDRSINGTFNFDKLYSKSKYLKKIESSGSNSSASSSRRRNTSAEPEKKDSKDGSKDDDRKNGKEKKEKKDREVTTVEKILIRPLLSLRTIKLNYKENLSTLLPGFQSTPSLFGLDKSWTAPGWQFASGLQPNLDYNDSDSYLREATENNWINPSPEFNQQILQNERQNFDASIKLEPFKYFNIDVDFNKSYNRANTREFKNKQDPTSPDFQQFAVTDIGSFEVSYLNFGTLFDNDIEGLFRTFLSNRSVISGRLDQQSVIDPTTGQAIPINGEIFLDNGEVYREGFRNTSTQVMIPAFLATYTDKSIFNTSLDIEKSVRDYAYLPKPNWSIRYDGLTKIPRFKKVFSSFSIEHGYRSSMGINSFRTDPLYRAPTDSNLFSAYETTNIKTGNYYSRLDIPSVTISEAFTPLIGITIKTKSDFLFDVEYRKSRDLDLTAGINGATLNEVRSTGVEAGIGYTFKNVELFGKNKKKSRSGKVREANPDGISKVLKGLNQEEEKVADADKDGKRSKRGVNNNRGNDLVVNFDFSYRDDVTYLHEETDPSARPVRGTKTLTLQPSAEYEVNKNFALRTFMSYRNTVPYATNQFQNTNFQFGITLRFKLE